MRVPLDGVAVDSSQVRLQCFKMPGGFAVERLQELFDRWYFKPLETLRSISKGDGGFIALAISCFLCERYATAILKESGQKGGETNIVRQFMRDFGTDQDTAQAFWKVMRHGLLHQGMPLQQEHGEPTLPRWHFSGRFSRPVELFSHSGGQVLRVQPWLVVDRVVQLCQENLVLFAGNDSFPWADIVQ